jgi:hypothetical protein
MLLVHWQQLTRSARHGNRPRVVPRLLDVRESCCQRFIEGGHFHNSIKVRSVCQVVDAKLHLSSRTTHVSRKYFHTSQLGRRQTSHLHLQESPLHDDAVQDFQQ